jgi:hypothetical protein
MKSPNLAIKSILTLAAVKTEFDRWRINKANRGLKIPENLWQLVFKLSKTYSPSEIAKTLHLSGSQLKQKIQEFKTQKNNKVLKPTKKLPVALPEAVNFLELPKQTLLSHANPIVKLEITTPAGARLCLEL